MAIHNAYRQYMYSYPHKTAYQYIENLDLSEYSSELAKNPIVLYFHIPFCENKCGYCNLFSIPWESDEKIDSYIEAVKRHAENYREVLDFEGVQFKSLIFGGGTPLILSINQLEKLFDIAEGYFGIDLRKVSISIETSPNQTTIEKLMFLKSRNVNRVSIGVQSFVQKELDKLKRFHNTDKVEKALKDLKYVGFDTLNIDLIYGIESQSFESLRYSLERAASYEPDEIFVYPLYKRPNTGIFTDFDINTELQYRMYFMICEFLKDKGYFQTSMRRFVKDKPSKEESCGFENMIALGCGGRSYIGNLHFCERYTSKQSKSMELIDKYIKRKEFFSRLSFYKLNSDELKRRFIIKNLFYYGGVPLAEYKRLFGTNLYEDFPIFQKFSSEEWIIEAKGRIKLTPLGLSLSDYIGPMLISDAVLEKMERFCDD
ncbi:STM4012 family radical SAM protein [Acetivibrio clariflavus]|uniref:STM4012 family radical SAM protein n=1 Tax=Acetivibrio clariflavus TaxID=288965 RepID=UPI0004869860|nr:STM4012 family radical SAM protein [Acetivibrio clariflavus]HOQ00556.1 STM4012 family radical SAM protein [Acetivibrio clariflavus]